MKGRVLEQVAATIIAVLIVAIATIILQFVTDGSLIRLLGGTTAQDVGGLAANIDELGEAVKNLTDTVAAESLLGDSEIVRISVVARTPGQPDDWPDLVNLTAPRVPAASQTYILVLQCSNEFVPATAWYTVVGSHPSIDVMYTINAGIDESNNVTLELRSREGASGYAYVDVFALCRPESG